MPLSGVPALAVGRIRRGGLTKVGQDDGGHECHRIFTSWKQKYSCLSTQKQHGLVPSDYDVLVDEGIKKKRSTRVSKSPISHSVFLGLAGTCLNDVELVDFAVSGEQRLSVHQLAHDAPYRPQVDGRVVASRAQQQLGGAVPSKIGSTQRTPKKDGIVGVVLRPACCSGDISCRPMRSVRYKR